MWRKGQSCSWSWEGLVPTHGDHRRWNFISVAHKFSICLRNHLGLLLSISSFGGVPSTFNRCAGTESPARFVFSLFCKALLSPVAVEVSPLPSPAREGVSLVITRKPQLQLLLDYTFAVLRRPCKLSAPLCRSSPARGQRGRDPVGPAEPL